MKTKQILALTYALLFGGIVFANNPTVPPVPPPPPANDLCDNAITLTVGTTCNFVTYDQSGATATTGPPAPGCGGSSLKDIWFKFVVPAGGNVVIDTQAGSLDNSGMALYSGSCSSLSLLSCNDDQEYANSMSKIYQYGLTPGATIYIRVWGVTSLLFPSSGNFGICVKQTPAPPTCGTNPIADNLCDNATPMCNLNGYCGNTSSSYNALNSQGVDEDDAQLGDVFCGSIENNSWLKFMADSTAAIFNIFVSNCADAHGIQMEIYSTTDCLNFTANSNCWNPGVVTNGEVVATGLTPGQVYYLMIDGNAGDVCDYMISASAGVATSDAGPDVSICNGASTQLNATGGTTFAWSPTTGLSNPNIANPIASPSTTTTYTVTISGTNIFCPAATDQVTVTVTTPVPTASSNSPVCVGNTLTFSTSIPNAAGYTWSGPNGFSNNTSGTPSISNVTTAASGTYSVTISLGGGCSGTAQTTVSITNPPVISISGNPLSGCQPLSVTFSATSTPAAQNYAWNFGNSMTSTAPNPSTLYPLTGQYNVSVNITDINGCSNSKTENNFIMVHPKPSNLSFSIDPPNLAYVGDDATFTSSYSIPNSNWNWNFGDGQAIIVQNPTTIHKFLRAGIYTITHIVTNEFGCTDTTSMQYTVLAKIIIPNIFTPNNDGQNDLFVVDGLESIDGVGVKIYNRWGRKVFDSDSYKNNWNGENAADGIYYYVLTLPDYFKLGPYNGSLTIMR
jgi:gliding motility-associated-like protein